MKILKLVVFVIIVAVFYFAIDAAFDSIVILFIEYERGDLWECQYML